MSEKHHKSQGGFHGTGGGPAHPKAPQIRLIWHGGGAAWLQKPRQSSLSRFRARQGPGAVPGGGSSVGCTVKPSRRRQLGSEAGRSYHLPAIFAKISDSFPAGYCQREGTGLAGPQPRSRLCS